jgi:hypothetical protein
MATYRVNSTYLRKGYRIAELPLSDLSFSSELNGAGQLSGDLHLPSNDPLLAQTYNDAVDEVRRQLVVERDGTIVWCGIVWAAPYDDESQTRSVRAAETWSYYRRRTISTRRIYRNADQFAIARQLLSDAAAQTGGDIGVTIGTETSGVLRDRNYEAWERKNLGEAIEQLAEVNNGFDFGIDARWGPTGDIIKEFRLFYPRRGRRFASTGLVFEVGRNNLLSWDWPTDGTRYANRIINVGAGEAEKTLSTVQTNAGQVTPASDGGAGYPLIEQVLSNVDVTRQGTLTAQAQLALTTYSQPVVVPTIVVRSDIDPIFGTYSMGDAMRFICQPGLTPRFPDGIDTFRRIVGWTVNVTDEGSDEVALTLGVEDGA